MLLNDWLWLIDEKVNITIICLLAILFGDDDVDRNCASNINIFTRTTKIATVTHRISSIHQMLLMVDFEIKVCCFSTAFSAAISFYSFPYRTKEWKSFQLSGILGWLGDSCLCNFNLGFRSTLFTLFFCSFHNMERCDDGIVCQWTSGLSRGWLFVRWRFWLVGRDWG